MIRKIKWNDHAILGNLELDFTKPDGSVYNTIVLAGENGTGKTTILETLSTFLNLGSIEPFEYISYMADGGLPHQNRRIICVFSSRKAANTPPEPLENFENTHLIYINFICQ